MENRLKNSPSPFSPHFLGYLHPPGLPRSKVSKFFFWGLQAPATGQLGGSSCLTQPSPRFQRSYRKNLRKLIIHQGC